MITIIPAILPDSYRAIEFGTAKVHDAVSTVQIDFVDGHVAHNRTWLFNNKDQERLSALVREDEGLPFWSTLNYELDLMVKDPLQYMDSFMALGPSKIIFHIEWVDEGEMIAYFESLPEIVRQTVNFGMALSLGTDPEKVRPYLPYINTIQCMGIEKIGFQGQEFDERVYALVEKVHALYPDHRISVDGGVTMETGPKLASLGARTLVVGSLVFQSEDPHGTIKKLKQLCKEVIRSEN